MPEWFHLLDYIEATLWAIAYIYIVKSGFKNTRSNKMAIPFTSVMFNFSWELLSIIQLIASKCYSFQAWYIRVLWFVIDIPILYLCYKKMSMYTKDVFFKKWFFSSLILITIVFAIIFQIDKGMLILSFYINLRMQFLFFKQRKKLDSTYRVQIASWKMWGTIFAGIYNSFASIFVLILFIPTIIFDFLYLVYAIKEKRNPKKYQLDNKPEYAKLIDKISELRKKEKMIKK